MTRRLFALLAIPAALAIPGHASANSFGADADCVGLTFRMPRGEAGTVVEASVDGRRVAIGTVANQNDPIGFTVPNPDPTTAHTWVVTIDSLYNADQLAARPDAPFVIVEGQTSAAAAAQLVDAHQALLGEDLAQHWPQHAEQDVEARLAAKCHRTRRPSHQI